MAQSLTAMYVHLVFSTKGRTPLLNDPEVRAELHRYLGGESGRLGYSSLGVGGTADHVHMLARQGKTLAVADWVGKVKSHSSNWIKDHVRGFTWQAGYGAFSVSPREVEEVRRYVLGQEEHHRTVSFQEEFRRILEELGVPYDEKYVWD